MPERTPSRIPAPSAASGSGTSSFSPPSSPRRAACRAIRGRPRSWLDDADLARSGAMAADALPRQVLAIREAVEVLGQLDRTR